MDDKKSMDELQYMKDWCIAILEYMSKRYNLKEFYQGKIDRILLAAETNNKRGLKLAYRDINEDARELPENFLIELNGMLQDKFGKSLIDEKKIIEKMITKIMKRGRINNEDEYRIVTSYINEIYMDEDKKQVTEKLDSFLFEFKNKKAT